MKRFEVTIRSRKKPENELESMLEWVCESLGLVKGRDVDKTSTKMLMCLLRHIYKHELVSPEEIAKELNMARSTVLHHLKKYEKAGLIIRTKGGYELRERTLFETVEEIERDIEKEFERIKEIAKKIDDVMLREE